MTEKTRDPDPETIIFLHPDLGIGGAERLVVDAAVGLQDLGHKVVIFTSHCDPQHCFDEARDGTLDVRVRGNTIVPPSILSRFSILCSILRQLHLILQIYLTSELATLNPDAFFVDQLSAGLPLLQLLRPRARVLFYCHFPDLLLAQGRGRWWKRAYRAPFDRWEQLSMGAADAVAVNSRFTRGVVSRTWPGLARKTDLEVVYPCVDTRPSKPKPETDDSKPMWGGKRFLLSINRFERKKDMALAVRAFAGLDAATTRRGARLVVAGGYDARVAENVGCHRELEDLATSLGLRTMTARTHPTALDVPDDVEVLFLHSVPLLLKDALLRAARLLVYTPANEHFGIVPLEAMLARLPVLAADTGGPVETVVDGVTGWLRSPARVDDWTDVMRRVLDDLSPDDLNAMGRAGERRVRENFGRANMAARLDDIIRKMLRAGTPPRRSGFPALALLLLVGAASAVALRFVVGA
ncbi:glycosyltransferase family 4 protein [Hypoxylon sp. FL1284]|nr:glycosyltransferase family 4 protein [Hypoxylon sp. FL1284]